MSNDPRNPAAGLQSTNLCYMRKLQYSLHFVGPVDMQWPEEGNFAGGPSFCVFGTAGMAASVRIGGTCTSLTAAGPDASSTSEQLDYIADMVQELQHVQANGRAGRDPGVAYHEALRRRREGSGERGAGGAASPFRSRESTRGPSRVGSAVRRGSDPLGRYPETSWWPCRSMRPAKASSMRAICRARAGKPVARAARRCRPAPGRGRRADEPGPGAPGRSGDGASPLGTVGAGSASPADASQHRRSVEMTSSGSVAMVAPVFSSRWCLPRGSSGWPGTARSPGPARRQCAP